MALLNQLSLLASLGRGIESLFNNDDTQRENLNRKLKALGRNMSWKGDMEEVMGDLPPALAAAFMDSKVSPEKKNILLRSFLNRGVGVPIRNVREPENPLMKVIGKLTEQAESLEAKEKMKDTERQKRAFMERLQDAYIERMRGGQGLPTALPAPQHEVGTRTQPASTLNTMQDPIQTEQDKLQEMLNNWVTQILGAR